MNRRDFLRRAAGSALSAGIIGRVAGTRVSAAEDGPGSPTGGGPELKKAVMLSMLPNLPSVEDRFRLARDLGFQGIEAQPVDDPKEARKMREAAQKVGIELHSVIYGGWHAPLSSPDPEVARKGADGVAKALESAKELGADGVLLVPAVVNEKTRYVKPTSGRRSSCAS